ncbi:MULTISPECIES: hypothetical protein [unclassified Agarivorans]|uniref:hypothetical protein n=1 Tax=unclassified Agarivorans TaxID=2636026 RepID=UPI0026E43F64|nr:MULTISPECIES: hypothetical protein [unclassified Agarivorans]MDO6686774.1 hypothetical protein [Agarivorans sp. 3_MG-2023]MDO6716496.1 hypothetical protein [Agarivorans sp. 2_MG-2023]
MEYGSGVASSQKILPIEQQTELLDYKELYTQGLVLVQQLSGDSWTDYNVHDPGVTLLEHLCFALSDLSYRASFSPQSYLNDSGAEQDYNQYNLFDHATVSKIHPNNGNDLRQLLLNEIDSLEDVLVLSKNDSSLNYLKLTLYISIRPDLSNKISEALIEQTRSQIQVLYAKNRCLNQDLDAIEICENQFYQLSAVVELISELGPAELLAEIYFRCCGDLTEHDSQNEDGSITVPLSDLYQIVENIPGVLTSSALSLIDKQGSRCSTMEQHSFSETVRIRLPQTTQEIAISLHYQGRELSVDFEEFALCYQERLTKYQSEHRLIDKKEIPTKKFSCSHKKLNEYVSLSQWLPANFRVGVKSFPPAKDTKGRATALQLKGYLALFEYVLTSKLSLLNDIKYLFAPNNFKQTLACFDKDLLRDIDHLAPLLDDKYTDFVKQQAVSGRVNIAQRSRILDYLLALYGEQLKPRVAFDYLYYHTAQDAPLCHLNMQRRMLRHIVNVNKHRLKATDLCATTLGAGQISGVQLKASLLLGFDYLGLRSLSFGVFRNHLELMPANGNSEQSGIYDESPSLASYCLGNPLSENVDLTNFSPLNQHSSESVSFTQFNHYFGALIKDGRLQIPESAVALMLGEQAILVGECRREDIKPFTDNERAAVDEFHQFEQVANQHVDSASEQSQFAVVFHHKTWQNYYLLESFADLVTAKQAAKCLRSYFVQLSLQSEGLHVLEHELLARSLSSQKLSQLEQSLLGAQISLVLPNWTARTQDLHFCEYAEQQLRELVPAHIYPHILWLDIGKMYRFEQAYIHWLFAYRNDGPKADATTKRAAAVISILSEFISADWQGGSHE